MSRPAAGPRPPAELPLPLLGLALTRRPPAAALPLLVALHEWCLPATLDPAAGTVLGRARHGGGAAPRATRGHGRPVGPVGRHRHRGLPYRHRRRLRRAGRRRRCRRRRAGGADRPLPRASPADVAVRARAAAASNAGSPPTRSSSGTRTAGLYGAPGRLAPIADELAETALGVAAAVVVTDAEWLVRAARLGRTHRDQHRRRRHPRASMSHGRCSWPTRPTHGRLLPQPWPPIRSRLHGCPGRATATPRASTRSVPR